MFEKYGVSEPAKARIEAIHNSQAKQRKSSTNECRKDRLLTALFHDFERFLTLVKVYRGLLEKLEGYVKKF